MGGLCHAHYEEDFRKRCLRDQAVRALHFGEVDGLVVAHTLQEDLQQLRDRWQIVCSVNNLQRNSDLVPLAEAKYAAEWCKSFAEQIIEAQRAINAGMPVPFSYENTKRWVWERLNGIERTQSPADSTTQDHHISDS